MDDVTVLVFGPLRERIGAGEIHVDGATVQEVSRDEVVRRHPAAAIDAGSIRVARNLAYCEWTTAVHDGDTIAFIPPVAGGPWTSIPGAGVVHRRAESTSPRSLRVLGRRATVRWRRSSAGCATITTALPCNVFSAAYAEMAEAEMRGSETSCSARGGISTVTIAHRVGALAVGDASVVVVVAAPHRGSTAFPACQEALELIKSTVPVWKRGAPRADGAV